MVTCYYYDVVFKTCRRHVDRPDRLHMASYMGVCHGFENRTLGRGAQMFSTARPLRKNVLCYGDHHIMNSDQEAKIANWSRARQGPHRPGRSARLRMHGGPSHNPVSPIL
jgi:hypothetical protein